MTPQTNAYVGVRRSNLLAMRLHLGVNGVKTVRVSGFYRNNRVQTPFSCFGTRNALGSAPSPSPPHSSLSWDDPPLGGYKIARSLQPMSDVHEQGTCGHARTPPSNDHSSSHRCVGRTETLDPSASVSSHGGYCVSGH